MIYGVLIVLGLALGSFVNALVWRLHEQSKSKKLKPELSILRGRSMCPHCKHRLSSMDLVPLLSWMSLKGRCRYCGKRISPQYPLVELMTAVLFTISYGLWPYGSSSDGILLFVIWLITVVGLMALTVYDIKWMLLPNRIIYPLIGLWVFTVIIRAVFFNGGLGMVLGALAGLVACGGLFWLIFQVSDGKWIGGGDVKLGFLLGIIGGNAMEAFVIIFVASLLGTMWVLPQLINKRIGMKAQVPFGPFLIAAGVIVFLLGQRLMDSFSGYFLLS